MTRYLLGEILDLLAPAGRSSSIAPSAGRAMHRQLLRTWVPTGCSSAWMPIRETFNSPNRVWPTPPAACDSFHANFAELKMS